MGRARQHEDAHADVEVELVRERADALGRTGRALGAAIDAYHAAAGAGALHPVEEDRLLAAVADRVYRLLLQRECLGARHGNLEAIQAAYDVPEAALHRV